MIRYANIADYSVAKTRLAGDMAILSEEETNRLNKYRRIEDQVNFLLGRILVKTTLNCRDPQSVLLVADEMGKLTCSFGNNSTYKHFNISHSDGFITAIFSKDTPAGIDVERITDIDYHDILKNIASTDELEFFHHSTNKQEAFYHIWTLKEAILKLHGSGFSRDPQKISILYEINSGRYNWLFKRMSQFFYLSAVEKRPVDFPEKRDIFNDNFHKINEFALK